MTHLKSIILLLLVSLLVSCSEKEPAGDKWKTTPYKIDVPNYFPSAMAMPDDNPMTVEGVLLGRYLFYDGRLSGRVAFDSLMSCGNCHVQSNNFRAGLNNPLFRDGIPVGIMGHETSHSTLPLVNLAWNKNGYTWNGSISPGRSIYNPRNIEDIVLLTIMHPHELAGDTSKTVALISSIKGYPQLFKKAFGSEKVTAVNIARAIAQFVRSLVSANSRFDKYMRGDLQLNNSELEGFILFTTEEGADCFHCHGSSGNPLFTTNLFYNNGKDTIFNDKGDRFSYTGYITDKGAYKATTLRNIAVSGPYMHDGRFRTLDEVIDFYSHNVQMSEYISPLMHHASEGGIQLNPSEKASLKAFLQSLTDEEFLTNPKYSPPHTFPDGKTYQEVKGKY